MIELTEWQYNFLEGMSHSNFYISASEWGNPELGKLIEEDLVRYWKTSTGAPMGGITPNGQTLLNSI